MNECFFGAEEFLPLPLYFMLGIDTKTMYNKLVKE